MQKTIEVFENDEAERFLEYFLAYKEFSKKTDYIRRILASNRSKTSCESFSQISKSKQPSKNHSDIGIDLEVIRGETDFTRLEP